MNSAMRAPLGMRKGAVMTLDVASLRGVPSHQVNSPAGNCMVRHLSREKHFRFPPGAGKVTRLRI
jgi:hypothetical protein